MKKQEAPNGMPPAFGLNDKQAQRYQKELEFYHAHKHDTNEMLLQHVKNLADQLGHMPTKEETIGYIYLKQRLGNWPTIMVKIGLKEPREARRARNASRDAENQLRRQSRKRKR